MCNKADISMGSRISDSCRKKLAKLPDPIFSAVVLGPEKNAEKIANF